MPLSTPPEAFTKTICAGVAVVAVTVRVGAGRIQCVGRSRLDRTVGVVTVGRRAHTVAVVVDHDRDGDRVGVGHAVVVGHRERGRVAARRVGVARVGRAWTCRRHRSPSCGSRSCRRGRSRRRCSNATLSGRAPDCGVALATAVGARLAMTVMRDRVGVGHAVVVGDRQGRGERARGRGRCGWGWRGSTCPRHRSPSCGSRSCRRGRSRPPTRRRPRGLPCRSAASRWPPRSGATFGDHVDRDRVGGRAVRVVGDRERRDVVARSRGRCGWGWPGWTCPRHRSPSCG